MYSVRKVSIGVWGKLGFEELSTVELLLGPAISFRASFLFVLGARTQFLIHFSGRGLAPLKGQGGV